MSVDPNYYSDGRSEVIDFLRSVELVPYGDVLDVGCSNGSFANSLATCYPLDSIDGVEINTDLEIIHPFRCLYRESIQNVEFNSKFDFIFMLDCLEHLENPKCVLLKLLEVLNTGGKLIITLPNFIYYKNLFMLIANRSMNYSDSGIMDRTHRTAFTKKDINSFFKDMEVCFEVHDLWARKRSFPKKIIFGLMGDFAAYQYVVVVSKS